MSKIPLLDALPARPNQNLAGKLQLYGRLIGSWKVDIDLHPIGKPSMSAEGEWHFGWVLDGNAIQDIWICPARHLRDGREPWYRYGTTLR